MRKNKDFFFFFFQGKNVFSCLDKINTNTSPTIYLKL